MSLVKLAAYTTADDDVYRRISESDRELRRTKRVTSLATIPAFLGSYAAWDMWSRAKDKKIQPPPELQRKVRLYNTLKEKLDLGASSMTPGEIRSYRQRLKELEGVLPRAEEAVAKARRRHMRISAAKSLGVAAGGLLLSGYLINRKIKRQQELLRRRAELKRELLRREENGQTNSPRKALTKQAALSRRARRRLRRMEEDERWYTNVEARKPGTSLLWSAVPLYYGAKYFRTGRKHERELVDILDQLNKAKGSPQLIERAQRQLRTARFHQALGAGMLGVGAVAAGTAGLAALRARKYRLEQQKQDQGSRLA